MNIHTAGRLGLIVVVWFAVSGPGERPYASGNFAQELDQRDPKGAVKPVDAQQPGSPINNYKLQQGWPSKTAASPLLGAYSANLRQPTTKNAVIVADGVSWQCQGTTCQASGAVKAPSVQSCRALAQQVGALNAFSIAGKPLGTGELAQCNAGLSRGALDQLQQNMPGAKIGVVPDRTASPEVWQQDKSQKPKPPSGGFVPKPSAPPAAKERTYPMELRTDALTVTGIGRRETETDAALRTAFRPRSLRVDTLTVTGIGRWETEEAARLRAAFRPVAFRTPSLTVTGTGRR